VIDGRYVLYDGMGAFGKGKRKVKFIPGKENFSSKAKPYNVNSLWFKKVEKTPATRLKETEVLSEEDKKRDAAYCDSARVQHWYRKPKDDYSNHPSFMELKNKHGEIRGADHKKNY
jgi:hypothetical protein